MNAITQFLLASAALGALATTTAVAGNAPVFHVTALHAGSAVNKTRMHNPDRQHLTYTFAIYTSIPASDLRINTKLGSTFYKWSTNTISYAIPCSNPPEKMKVPKRSAYAKLGWATETYSYGCPSGLTVFYGDTYKLTDKSGFGKTDSFVSTLTSKFTFQNGVKYRGTFNLDVSVAIGE